MKIVFLTATILTENVTKILLFCLCSLIKKVNKSFMSQNTGAKKCVLTQWKSNHKTRIELRRFFKDQDIHQSFCASV
jgi:hypothetical protein